METGAKSNGDGGTDPYVPKLDQLAEAFAPEAKTLSGDLRDVILDMLRGMPKAWSAMLEAEQSKRAHAANDAAKEIARKLVYMATAYRHLIAGAKLEQVTFKEKGVEAKIIIRTEDPAVLHALVDMQGTTLPLVIANIDQYIGERGPANLAKDQPDLPLDPAAEEKVDAELDTIIAGDESEPVAGAIPDLRQLREEAERNPYQAGRAAAMQGLNESHNPLDHPSVESADWLRGHAEGEAERLAAVPKSGKRRRRSNGTDEASAPA